MACASGIFVKPYSAYFCVTRTAGPGYTVDTMTSGFAALTLSSGAVTSVMRGEIISAATTSAPSRAATARTVAAFAAP